MSTFTFTEPTDHMPGAWHGSYSEVYEWLFRPYKNLPGIVMEIGTDGGGMLLAYHDWFPNSEIYGIDINPAPKCLGGKIRIHHLQRDAYQSVTVSALSAYRGQFNAIIDDGPHSLESQMFFAEHYPPLLDPRGVAVIEDIQDLKHVEHIARKVPAGFEMKMIDLREKDGRYDSVLLVIERPENMASKS